MANMDFCNTTVREFLQSILDNNEQFAVAAELRKVAAEESVPDTPIPDMPEMVEHVDNLIKNVCNADPDNYFGGHIMLGEDYITLDDDGKIARSFSISFCSITELKYFFGKKQADSVKTLESLPTTKGATYYKKVYEQHRGLVPDCDGVLFYNEDWGSIADMYVLMESVDYFGRIPFAAHLLLDLAPGFEDTMEEHRSLAIQRTEFEESYDDEPDDEDDEVLQELHTVLDNEFILNFFASDENRGLNALSLTEIHDLYRAQREQEDVNAMVDAFDECMNLTDEDKRRYAYSNAASTLAFVEQIQTIAEGMAKASEGEQ